MALIWLAILGRGGSQCVCGTGTCHLLRVVFQQVADIWVSPSDILHSYGFVVLKILQKFKSYRKFIKIFGITTHTFIRFAKYDPEIN